MTAVVALMAAGLGASPPAPATITGTVLDDRGVPVAGCRVTLVADGEEHVAACGADGSFSLDALPAGTYEVNIWKPGHVLRGYVPGEVNHLLSWTLGEKDRRHEVIHLSRTAAIEGTIRDRRGNGIPGVSVGATPPWTAGTDPVALAPVQTDLRGRYRIANVPPGAYVVMAKPPASIHNERIRMIENGIVKFVTFATTYYGAGDDAATLDLEPGDRRAGVDLVLDAVELSSVNISFTGASAAEQRFVRARLRSNGPAGDSQGEEMHPRSDGRWVANVPPGRYVVEAYTHTPAVQLPVTVRELAGRAELSVAPGTAVAAKIALRSRLSLRVRVEFAESSGRLRNFAMLGSVVAASSQSPEGQLIGFSDAGDWIPQWNPLPGTYRVVPLDSSTWSIASLTFDGQDVLGREFVVDAPPQGDLVVRASSRVTPSIRGRTIDAAGYRVFQTAVIAFPQNPAEWTSGSTRVTAPDAQGRFLFSELQAGEYLVAAYPLGMHQSVDRPLLAELATTAASVTVTGQKPAEVTITARVPRRP